MTEETKREREVRWVVSEFRVGLKKKWCAVGGWLKVHYFFTGGEKKLTTEGAHHSKQG
jgi:hypothetical protein